VWRNRLRALIEWSLCPELVDLAVELIGRGDLDDARGPIAVNSDFFSIVYGLKDNDPDGAAQVIGAYLRRATERARIDGSSDPFASDHIPESSSGGDTVIQDVAAGAPVAFVREILPFVVEVASATAEMDGSSPRRKGGRWRYRHVSEHHGVDDAVFLGVELGLRQLAENDPEETRTLIEPLMSSDLDELKFLACRTLSVLPTSNDAIEWLLADDTNLRLGWLDSPRWATRELVEHATRTCDDEHLNALTGHLLSYYPDWERSYKTRQAYGHAQYELLSAVACARRTVDVSRRLGELERKFKPLSWDPHPPTPMTFQRVAAPLPEHAAPHMTDQDWLRAIAKHSHDEMRWTGEQPVGGSDELAGLLARRAQAEPERFAALALKFGPGTPPTYFSQAIRAVSGKVPVQTLSRLCQQARLTAGPAVARDICAAAEADGAGTDDGMLSLLEACASDDDPALEPASPMSGPTQDDDAEDLLVAGWNCTRGAAARAVAHVLFTTPTQVARLAPTVAALAADPVLAVRTTAADAVMALIKHRHPAGLELAETLFDAEVRIFDSSPAARLLRTALLYDPQRFTSHLIRALDGPDAVARRAGTVWAIAHLRNAITAAAPSDVSRLALPARRGAAQTLSTVPAAATEALASLFDDDDSTVRQAAASALRHIADTDPTTADILMSAFVGSAAFVDHFDNLFYVLDDFHGQLPPTTLLACERAVQLASERLGDIRTRHVLTSTHIVSVVLRLYREGGPELRRRCLDVIDALADARAYGLTEALADER
jgi:hypothetical protein